MKSGQCGRLGPPPRRPPCFTPLGQLDSDWTEAKEGSSDSVFASRAPPEVGAHLVPRSSSGSPGLTKEIWEAPSPGIAFKDLQPGGGGVREALGEGAQSGLEARASSLGSAASARPSTPQLLLSCLPPQDPSPVATQETGRGEESRREHLGSHLSTSHLSIPQMGHLSPFSVFPAR